MSILSLSPCSLSLDGAASALLCLGMRALFHHPVHVDPANASALHEFKPDDEEVLHAVYLASRAERLHHANEELPVLVGVL